MTVGQRPGSYYARFRDGPWDGLAAEVEEPPERLIVPNIELASYRRESMSELPAGDDLTDKHVARGVLYRWQPSDGVG